MQYILMISVNKTNQTSLFLGKNNDSLKVINNPEIYFSLVYLFVGFFVNAMMVTFTSRSV